MPATFAGTLPCRGCAGPRGELTLFADSSYSLRGTIAGPGDRSEQEHGSWGYSSDRLVVVLRSTSNTWTWFAVQPGGALRPVDSRGDSIDLRASSDLVRTASPSANTASSAGGATPGAVTVPLSGIEWTLTELENKPVRPASATRRDIVLTFSESTPTFSGMTACNSLAGAYAATWRTLTLTPARSLRVCLADAGTERALSRTIKTTRAYRITGTTLDFFDEQGKPIARFVAK